VWLPRQLPPEKPELQPYANNSGWGAMVVSISTMMASVPDFFQTPMADFPNWLYKDAT
jgi:hypothetical protein